MKLPAGRILADDDKLSVKALTLMRIPPLIVGLLLGLALSFVTSRFEEVLSKNIQVVFFLPFIVYMADAVGTQTQTIYTRDLGQGVAKFTNYLIKETLLGLVLGITFGTLSFFVAAFWTSSTQIGLAVGLAMALALATAPIVAILITEVLQLEHQDPAVDAGPIATVIQDTISVIVYGITATLILL